ncbi:PAS domain S-box protein [Pedobacter sp. P351]|uniref:PAS domain S-box protein n=1 Tax=Pedobacter superstes TaxID=3133441 RepID=UPI0030B64DB2
MIQNRPDLFNQISSHQAFQQFHDTGVINILGINKDGIIVYANAAELKYTGYTAEEYIGKPLSDFYTDEQVLQKLYESMKASEELYNLESVIKCKNGNLKYALLSSRNIEDATGINYAYLFIRDISLYKKNERLLSYLNTAAEVLAGARNTSDALNKVSDLIVPKFANWFTIDLLKDGKLELIKLAHEDPKFIKVALEYREKYPVGLNADQGSAFVLKTGQPFHLPFITPEMLETFIPDPEQLTIVNQLGVHSSITVAMFNKETITGLVTFISSSPDKNYDEADLRFAQNFANHIGLTLENTRLNAEALAEIERRRKIEEELKRTQIQLKSALSSGLIGTWVRDLENEVMYVDESLSKIFDLEYSSHGIDPMLFINRIHPDDIAATELKRKECIDKGGIYEAEYRIITGDERIKWVFARGSTDFNSAGKAVKFSGVVGEITERKLAEEALKQSEKRFRLMAETMPQKIFVTDAKANLLYLNPQWEKFTGYSIEEINKLTLSHFIHPDDLKENLKRWKDAVENSDEFQFEHRFKAKDGKYYWHLTRALALQDSSQNNMWIGSITDIDEQKKNEQKKDEFISIASHELKTPITSLNGYLQILSRRAESEKLFSVSDLIVKTQRQAHKLSSLISDLLDVSKMQAGKMNYNFAEFNFAEIIDDAITDSRNNYPSHTIKLNGNHDVLVFGDKHRLEQVLSNLLSNAAKYSPDSDEILLIIKTSGEMLTLSVQDYGVGIPEEKAPYIFNRFFRVEDTSFKFSGLGIGLFISREIIQRHKGKLYFDSKVGEGSTFTFTIPIHGEEGPK